MNTIYESINMDRKLLKKGGRKAPQMSIEELKKQLIKHARANPYEVGYSEEEIKKLNEKTATEEDFCAITFDMCQCNSVITKDLYTFAIEEPIDKFPLSEFHTLENGFTFYGCAGEADWTNSFFYIIYFDGKKFRGYVPKFGNTVISGKGFEAMCNEYWEFDSSTLDKMIKKCNFDSLNKDDRIIINHTLKELFDNITELPLTGIIPEEILDEIPGTLMYRIINGYPIDKVDDYNWDAIKEDIQSRIEIV